MNEATSVTAPWVAISPGAWAAVMAAAVLLGAAAWLLWSWGRRRAAGSIPARLRQVCDDLLTGVLLPDPDHGQIHIDFALLTRQGVVVIDVKDVEGHVFGSEAMQEWTVLTRDRRFTFNNPLPALYDQMAAIRRLLPEIPVRGYVVFTDGADFGKTRPPHVTLLEDLIADLDHRRSAPEETGTRQVLQPLWERLRHEVAGTAGRDRERK